MTAYPPNPTNPPTTTSTTVPGTVPAGRDLPDTGNTIDIVAALILAVAAITIGVAAWIFSGGRATY